jgi:CO/xanthine dehydrogenase FAD-binding subunit
MPITVRTVPGLAEAASLLSSSRGARYLGGGTLLMRDLNEGDTATTEIIRATDPQLRQIRASGSRIEIGAGVTMSDVLASRDLAFLHAAARAVGGPAVRNMATVGGNLFAGTPYGDFTAALLALDAGVSLAGGYGQREMTLEDFLAGRARAGQGLVSGVGFNRPATPDALRFTKVTRVKPKGVSVLSIAALVPVAGGRVQGARIAYGAMAPTPIRARAAERALEGRALDEAGVASALAVAAEGTSPATDALATAWYRREVLPVHLKRLLLGHS